MFVFDAPPQASLAVQNSSDRFPIQRIFCVGQNYAKHVIEMGNDPRGNPPIFFTKPADAAMDTPCTMPYPPQTNDLHFEIELVIAIGKGGANIAQDDVMDHVWGAAVGIDMTRRDLQTKFKKGGKPWDMAKGFDHSAPIGPIKPIADVPSVTQARIWLAVNGEIRQDSNISDLIWSVREHIATLSESVTLAAGDLIMTGTPDGVGAVNVGDVMTGGVDGIGEIEVSIGPKAR